MKFFDGIIYKSKTTAAKERLFMNHDNSWAVNWAMASGVNLFYLL
jgi:hypothetical protein